MSDTTIEQKLQLVRQVRSRYQEDQCDLSNRERLLYGHSSVPSRDGDMEVSYGRYGEYEDAEAAGRPVSFLKIRLWIALLLAAAVIVMDRNGMSVAGVTSEKIFEAIAADYEQVLEAWAETRAR